VTDVNVFKSILSASFLFAVIRVSTPILLASLGGLVADLAGVTNIALEGIMLSAALMGVVGSAFTQSAFLGLLFGVLAGVVLSILLAYFRLHLGADGTLTGLAINMLAAGGTVFILFSITRDKAFSTGLQSISLPNLKLPLISSIPFIGEALSGHNVMTYIAFLLVPLVGSLLYRTRFGIHLRGVGENPSAAAAVGIDVVKTQYYALILSGVLAALGGINLSMGYLSLFVKDMTAGRGFIALAAVYLGGRTPAGVMYASLLFGLADALANQLGSLNIPPQVVLAIPYIVTVVALVVHNVRVENARVARRNQAAA
jgi:ABC-type uncharacterized transport system permease subunit